MKEYRSQLQNYITPWWSRAVMPAGTSSRINCESIILLLTSEEFSKTRAPFFPKSKIFRGKSMAVPATSIFNDVPISAFRENWMDCISRTLSSSRAAASNSACCFSFLWRNSVIPCCTIKVKCDNQRLGYKNRRPNEKFVPYRKYSISVLPRKPVAQCVHLCDIFSSFNSITK